MSKKRYFSLILSILMLLQIIAPLPAQAMTLGQSGAVQKSEGQVIDGKSEVFAFKNTKKPKMSWFNTGTMSTYRARSASTTRTETLKINTKATGLDDGDKPFNWAAFGQNKKFKAWINVAYVEDRKPGESVATERHKVSEDFEISAEGEIDATVTLDASKTVDYYYLKTEYDTDDAAFRINAFFGAAPSLSPKATADLIFHLDIYQIVSTKVTYNLLDEYGKVIDLNDAKQEKPADTDLKDLGKVGKDIAFDLKKSGTEILRKEQGIDEWDLTDSSLALSLTKNEIKSNNIDYKLSSTYNVLEGGTVTIQRQKDVVTPKDPRNPGNIPEGYARINLSADTLGGKTDGTFTKDDATDTQRVVDVKAGKAYTTAQAEVDKVAKPFPLTSEKKVDTGKTFDKWTPALSTLGTAVEKETKTLNASYKSSDAEIIPYLPTEQVPTKDKDGLPIPQNYLTVTFKSEDANKGKVKIGDKEGATVLAKVKPGIDLSKKAEITTVPETDYGFTEWKPALGVPQANSEYTAHFVKSGSEINDGDPIPKGWFKVTVSQDEDSIKSGTVTKAVYTVKPNDKLGQDKFANLEGKANDGFKDPAWYVGSEKIAKPYEKEITTSTDFVARATEEIANKFKNNGLKAVDITAYKGDKIEGKFWNKGVTVQREDPVLERLIESATVTDTTVPARTTDKAGTFSGTLKVTFEDGSSLEVQNQRLIVIDTKVDIDYDKDSKKDANAPRHKDEVVKGKIKSEETLEGAKVEILDKDNNVIGITLADKNGSFIAGTRELQAGEKIKVRVTLPKAKEASPAVEKQVQLNPDELNSILPTADKVAEHFKDKKGVDQTKVATLEEAIEEAYKLVDKAGEGQEQKDQKAKAATPSKAEQDKLDEAYKAIKAAIKNLTENKIPEIKAPSYKEIFVNDDINLDEGVSVTDDNIKQVNGKDYSYKIYDGSDKETTIENMKANAGTYRVVYKAEDTQGVKAEHTMTVVVKKTVLEVPGEFPEKTPEGYVKVEFKSGENAGLNGVSKFLVKKDAPKSEVKEPTIIPKEGYKVADPKWSKEIPATFADNFETTAQVLAKVTTTEPEAKDKEKYAKLTFEKGDHGEFAENAKTAIWVLKGEKVQFNAPKIKANDGFTFAGWEPELKESYDADQTHTAKYASNSDISDTEVKGFQEVKFVAGKDGNFGNDVKEKSVWVRPGKLVDLRTKAPKVTVTTEGKSFIGWDKDLVQTFTKAKEPTVINAKYDDTVKTEEPKENKEKYAKVDFSAGNLGTIADDATKTYWVVKDAEVKLTPPTVKANEGWKLAENAWKPAVATKYTQDTIHVAQYDYNGASVIPQKPGEDKPVVPENFVKVEFKKGEHGVISSEETTVYWVDPTKEVELKAPAVIADKNYKHDGWNKELKNTFAQKTDIVAQYKSTVVTEDPKDANYVTVEFDAKDHGTLKGDAKFWVYKNEKVSITAPEVTAKDGYTFDKWDPAVKDSYAEATVHNATYTTNNNVSDTEVEGYNKVTFKAGDHGTLTEKSVWVKPDTVVDLNDKAPAVTPEKGYSHIGWKPALIGKFENNTEIVAQYSNSISDKPVEGWTELTFDQGDHGKFAKGAKNVKWVNPKVELKLKDIAPAIVADTNYSLDGWKDGETKADLEKAQKFETAKTFTATYKSNVLGKDEHGNLPEDEKKNFVQITFNEGKNGKFPKEAVKEVYVKKDVEVDLTEKAPTVIPNQGYGHNGWNPALKGTFSAATTITAQYKEGTFDENAIKEIMVVGPTKMGYGEGEKLDLTGLKVIAKDDAGLQQKYEGVDAIKAAGYTIAPANETVLTKKDHDGQPIKVTKGSVEGQTETTLTIHENKSTKAEDVKALNQNKVVDGKVTNEPKDTTTVTGKAPAGSTVIIKNEAGEQIGKVEKVPANGEFTAEVTKQDEGKKVQVIVTEDGKQPSEPAKATVARDANNDGKADKDADQKTATPTAKALNVGKEPTVTTITGKAEPGAKVVAKVGDVKVGEATADSKGDYKIEATKTGKTDGGALDKDTEVKVTAQVEGKLESEPATATVKIDKDGNGVADDEEQFDIKKATKVEIIKNPDKMKYAVKTKDGTTPFDATGVIIRLTDGSGKSKTYTYKDITEGPDKGKFTLSPADAEQIGLGEEGKVNTIPFKVTVNGADTKPSVTAEQNITVILDADGNGVDDRTEETAEPNVMARNIGKDPQKTTVEIETQPKAKVTIEYTDKDGQPKKIENLTAGDDGKLTYDKITPALKAGTDVKVIVQDGDKKPTEKIVKVFDDLDDNKIPDTQAGQTERPSALAYNFKDEAKTTIKGEAEPGSKVVAKVGDVKVGEATANSDGQYEISAIKDGAKLPKGTKVSVTATLDPKKPSSAQETVVYDDLDGDGQPDTAQAFDKDKIRGFEVVASPNKMVYNNKEKLELTGMKVLLTDQTGNKKLVEFSEFEAYGIKVSPLNGVELSDKNVADGGNNGQKIKAQVNVTIGNNQKTYSDETPTALKVNKDQSAQPTDVLAANQGDKATTTVKGKATPGAKVEVKNAKGDVIGTVDQVPNNGEFQVEVTKQADKAKVTVTATETGKAESAPQEATVIRDKDGDWKEDGGKVELEKPVVDTVKVGDESVKVQTPGEGITKITVKDESGKTIEVVKDGNDWKVDGKPVGKDGDKLVIPTKDKKLTFGPNETVEITNHDAEGNEGKTVVATKPANLKPMENPTIDPISTESKKVTGKALPGSVVKVTLPGSTVPQEALVKSDGSFELVLEKPLADKAVVEVTATNSQREGVGKAKATVGLNLQELEKTKAEADGLINDSKTGNNFDPNNKYDKNLEEKTKAAQDIIDKAKDNKDDNDPTQTQVNKAEEDLRDAINQKNADDKVKVVEKAVKDGQKPSEEQIKKAQDAIDKVTDPAAKKELQDRLDKAKLIDQLVDDVKNAPKKGDKGYDTKPADVIKTLEDAKKEAEKVINDYKQGTNTAGKTPEKAKEDLDKAIEEYNKEQVVVSVAVPSAGFNSLSITSLQPNVKITIFVDGKAQLTDKNLSTSPTGELVVSLDKPLESGQKVEIIGSKAGLMDGGASVTTP